MKYPLIANIINILFLGFFLLLPIIYILNDITLSDDDVRLFFISGVFLTSLLFADWYHFYYFNSFKSILFTFILGFLVAVVCTLILILSTETTIQDLITFKAGAWNGHNLLFKYFIVGTFMAISSIISIPRLIVIKFLTKQSLPGVDV